MSITEQHNIYMDSLDGDSHPFYDIEFKDMLLDRQETQALRYIITQLSDFKNGLVGVGTIKQVTHDSVEDLMKLVNGIIESGKTLSFYNVPPWFSEKFDGHYASLMHASREDAVAWLHENYKTESFSEKMNRIYRNPKGMI